MNDETTTFVVVVRGPRENQRLACALLDAILEGSEKALHRIKEVDVEVMTIHGVSFRVCSE